MSKGKHKRQKCKANGNKSKKNQAGGAVGERASHRRNRAKKHELSNDEYTAAQRELDQQLKGIGLYCKEITGDGNCLFRSLSDQFYGNTKFHSKVRKEICAYLEEKRDHFQMFVEDDNTFDYHLSQMKKDGTYGGNMELVAFAQLNNLNIKIYQPSTIFIIRGDDESKNPNQINTLHIAYHNWEHYSSVRKIEGPHEGNPEIETELLNSSPTNNPPNLLPNSIEKMIMNSTGENDISKIRTLMEKLNNDQNKVIEELFEEKQQRKTNETSNDDDDGIIKDKGEIKNYKDDLVLTPKEHSQTKEESNSKSSVLNDDDDDNNNNNTDNDNDNNNIEEKEQENSEKIEGNVEENDEKEDDEAVKSENGENEEKEEEEEKDMGKDGIENEMKIETSSEKSDKKIPINYSSNSKKDEGGKEDFHNNHRSMSRRKKRQEKKISTKSQKNKKFYYQSSNPINNDDNSNCSSMTQLYI